MMSADVLATRGYFGSWGYTNIDSVQSIGVSFRSIVHPANAGQVNIEICALSSLVLSSHPLLIDLFHNVTSALVQVVYQDYDVYLLADIFSAVDAHTGSAIFKVSCQHSSQFPPLWQSNFS